MDTIEIMIEEVPRIPTREHPGERIIDLSPIPKDSSILDLFELYEEPKDE